VEEQALRQAFAQGKREWPGIGLDLDKFREHCERVLGPAPEWEWTRFGMELYLCCACAQGDSEAVRVLEADTLPQAARVALDAIRSRNARKLHHADLPDRLAQTDSSPLNDIVKSRYRDSFQRALKHAIHALPARERNLLRLQLVGRCSIDQLGRMYLVHRATAARWLENARNRVFESVRQQMKLEHHLSDGEFDSIARGVRSQLDLSITATISGLSESAASSETAPPDPDPDYAEGSGGRKKTD
jgi:hypothetical protein